MHGGAIVPQARAWQEDPPGVGRAVLRRHRRAGPGSNDFDYFTSPDTWWIRLQHDLGADAFLREDLEQDRVGHSAVQDMGLPGAGFEGAE